MIRRLASWARRSPLRATALALLVLHLAAWGAASWGLAFPNPVRRLVAPEVRWDTEPLAFRGAEGREAALYVLPARTEAARGRRVVLFCHGRSMQVARYSELTTALAERFDVARFHFRSHGEHPYGTTSMGVHEADDVLGALDALERKGYARIAVVGHSMGGAATLLALGRRRPPAVRGAAVIGTYHDLDAVVGHWGRFFPPYLRWLSSRTAERLAGYRTRDASPERALPRIGCPVLALTGTRDRVVPAESPERLSRAGARLVRFGGGHDPWPAAPVAEPLVELLRERLED